MRTARVSGPDAEEVISSLELDPTKDIHLAEALVNWFKAWKAWRRNRDGTHEHKALDTALNVLDDYLFDDPNRKAHLMNQMINMFS